MFITGTGTATPPKRYLQSECWDAALDEPSIQKLSPRSRALIKKVLLGNNGIRSRHLAMDSISEAFDPSSDTLHARFKKHAPSVATSAAEQALAAAGQRPEAIDALIVSTCTGYLCPGLSSYLAENLKLRPDVFALDLVGQGCGAALPNLRTAHACIQSQGCEHVLSVSVEICSAAFYLDDDPGVLISACLFGDAAGAAVLSRKAPDRSRHVEWRHSTSLLDPAKRDLLRFESTGGRLRNILTPQVPELAGVFAEKVLTHLLADASVDQSEIRTWILHAGGRDVLLSLRDHLRLDETDLCWSARVLRDLGNISSPFVLHVLHSALTEQAPAGWWFMSSFGAGFSCHGALLHVE